MRLLSLLSRRPFEIPGSNLVLEQPATRHGEAWISVRNESREFLKPWEPTWPEDDLTALGYRRRLKAYNRHRNAGWGRTYFIVDESDRVLGGIGLSKISHGVSRTATLGYWMGVRHANKGIMQRAVPVMLVHAFSDLWLQRVDAACLPHNGRSIHLLEKCGFRREGYARKFLEIDGQRQDHLLFAILKNDYEPASRHGGQPTL